MLSFSTPVFLVLEGLDGSGKSAVASVLAERLDAKLLATPLPTLREFRSQVDEALSCSPLACRLWYAAQVVAASEMVRESLHLGHSVILDRYWLTTLAYSRFQEEIALPDEIAQTLLCPDATILLRPPFAVRISRLQARGNLQSHDRLFLTPFAEARMYQIYHSMATHPVAGRFCELKTQADWSIDKIVERILQLFLPMRSLICTSNS